MQKFQGIVCVVVVLIFSCGCGGGGGGAPVVANAAPTVSVVGPTDQVEIPFSIPSAVAIDYTDEDVDSAATTDIFADIDGDLQTVGDQVVVASGRPELDGTPQTVMWDPTGAPAGTYKIIAVTSDGANVAISVGPGSVMINAPPVILITSPVTDVAVSRGSVVPISYRDNDTDDAALTWLFADMDGDLDTTGDQTRIASARPELNGAVQTVQWDTTGMAFGVHGIHARTWDGGNTPAEQSASGTVEVRNVATATSVGGTAIERGTGIASYADGSSVVVGHFAGSPTFGLGELGETTPTAVGGDDLFVVRYYSTGAVNWVRTIGGATSDVARSVTALSDGSCVVTGWFEGAVTFGAGEGSETTLTATGVTDFFLARFNASGFLVWAKQAGGIGAGCYGLAVDAFADNSIAVTGSFIGPVTFGPGEGAATTLTWDANFDAFVARFGANGALTWAKRAHGAGSEEGLGIGTFSDGTCVVTGYFDGDATWGPGEAGATTLLIFGISEVWVARYSTTGTLVWVNQQGGTSGTATGLDVATYPDGTCAVCGWFTAAMDFGFGEANETNVFSSGESDSFVARFDPQGMLSWASVQGGLFFDAAEGIEALPDGGCAVAGYFELGAVFGLFDPNETVLLAYSGRDLVLSRLGPDGSLTWARNDGGTALQVLPSSLTRFPDGSFGVTGRFEDGAVLFGRDGNKQRPIGNAGLDDVFYARYNADGGF